MSKKDSLKKIIVIVGPTSSGKTSLSIFLSKKINGEVVSADSRQVYKGLDIGTGKVTKKEMSNIPHYLLDVSNPKNIFNASQYKELAEIAVENMLLHEKIPIIVGGTGFYIDALLDKVTLPDVPPNKKLRLRHEKLSTVTLLKKLQKLDPKKSKAIDPLNKRRLIRAIEIASALGKVPPIQKKQSPYKTLKIGISLPDKELQNRIYNRILARIKLGMIDEVRKLHKKGLSWKRMEELGLEYRYLSRHLRGKISKTEMVEQLNIASWQYAKRQMKWFKRDKNIEWFSPTQEKEIEQRVKMFLKK